MLTSVHLLYTIFYINNIFIFFCNIILSLLFLFSYSSSYFFFLISLPFPLSFSFSSSSFFFFLLLSLMVKSTLHHKHHNHQNPPALPISIDPQAPIYTANTDPNHQSTCSGSDSDGDEIASPIHDPWSPINDPQATIHNQSTTSTFPVDPQP